MGLRGLKDLGKNLGVHWREWRGQLMRVYSIILMFTFSPFFTFFPILLLLLYFLLSPWIRNFAEPYSVLQSVRPAARSLRGHILSCVLRPVSPGIYSARTSVVASSLSLPYPFPTHPPCMLFGRYSCVLIILCKQGVYLVTKRLVGHLFVLQE